MSVKVRPIVITGFMGAGKTAVAAALARRLACAMIDLDHFIKKREGRTAQTIIDEDGEARFREIEAQTLRDALETGGACIIALGGGAWTVPQNRALINEHGAFTVWLDAPFELCWHRIKSGKESRPLARDFDSARRLYDDRRAVYHQAMLRVEISDEKSVEAVANEIIVELTRSVE
jgi:shikimate kinase